MKRPRILFLTTYYHPYVGGVETHARQLADYLAQHDFEVTILTKRVDRSSPAVEKIDGLPVYRIPPAGKRTGSQKWIMIPLALREMLRLRDKLDLIYCPGYRGIGIAAILAGRLLRKPVILKSGNIGILSCSNWDASLARLKINPQGRLATLIKWPVHKIYASANAFACISHEIISEAQESNIDQKNIHYLPEGVNSKRFRPSCAEERKEIRSKEGWPEDWVIGIYVGRLSREKGSLELIEAWSLLKSPRAILVVVGPDMSGHAMDVGPAVRKLVAERGLNDQIILYGPSQDVPRLLRSADFFIQPSHYEAFGLSVIEAMATGLPVIASRVGGMTDYLIDGKNALLCEPRHPQDLARQIRRMLSDVKLRQCLGKEARATIERNFDETIIFDKFAQLFQETYNRECQ